MFKDEQLAETIDLLREAGIIEKDMLELTGEFHRQWRRLEISLSQMGPIEQFYGRFPDMKGQTYADISRVASIIGFFPQGLKPPWAERAFNLVTGILAQIPAWKIPDGSLKGERNE